MPEPARPKIVHICHVDRLPSIIAEGYLWSSAREAEGVLGGTAVGMANIKKRRLEENQLSSHPGLYVGQCVPFYFWPRSVMLYLLYRGNHPGLSYSGGQEPIVHLVSDLVTTTEWADSERLRWAFTTSNAASSYFEDYSDLVHLSQLNWDAIKENDWRDPDIKEAKQAEFLVETRFPWPLIQHIGVHSARVEERVRHALVGSPHAPEVKVRREWYY